MLQPTIGTQCVRDIDAKTTRRTEWERYDEAGNRIVCAQMLITNSKPPFWTVYIKPATGPYVPLKFDTEEHAVEYIEAQRVPLQ